MEKHTTSRPSFICFLVIKQISTGHVRKRKALLTPAQIDAYKLRLNKSENGYILLEIQEEI
jgi:hypothetical protein